MPQQQLLPDGPVIVGLRITLIDRTNNLEDALDFQVETIDHRGDRRTIAVRSLEGVMVDYLDTMMTTIVTSWLYGPPKEIPREIASVMRLARAHLRAHTG